MNPVRNILTLGTFLTGTGRMITSKLTSKAQTTIPQPVRAALGVKAGDELSYQIEEGRVVLTGVPVQRNRADQPIDDPFATFIEWDSEADRKAFADF